MPESIKVFAPATVANVSCGFDVLGFAVANPGDEVIITLSKKPGIRILKITGDDGRLPLDPLKNTVGVAIHCMLQKFPIDMGVEIILNKKMPLGSGLGSSAASAVAGVFGMNELLQRPFKRQDLLPFAIEGERLACGTAHADNAAPALLGGFVIIRSYNPLDVIKIPTPEELYCTIIHPHIEVETKDARSILPRQVSLSDAAIQWGNVAGLVAGLIMSDYDLIGRSMHDVIIEPRRAMLIPGFERAMQAALNAGALGGSISGSGPSMFALSRRQSIAEEAGEAMKKIFSDLNIGSEVYVSKVNNEGPIVIGG